MFPPTPVPLSSLSGHLSHLSLHQIPASLSLSRFLSITLLTLFFIWGSPAQLSAQFNPKLYNLVPELQQSAIARPVVDLNNLRLMAWTVNGWVSVKLGANLQFVQAPAPSTEIELVAIVPPPPVIPPPVPPVVTVLERRSWSAVTSYPSGPALVIWNGVILAPGLSTDGGDYVTQEDGQGGYVVLLHRLPSDPKEIAVYIYAVKPLGGI